MTIGHEAPTELNHAPERSVNVGATTIGSTCVDLARLIVPEDTPNWLPAFLEWWSAGFQHDLLVDEYRPTKAKSRKRLQDLKVMLDEAYKMLNHPAFRKPLELAKSSSRISIKNYDLRDLAERAEIAAASPLFTGKSGKTKAGRGLPKIPDLFEAKVLFAARVFELWLHFYKREPGLGNRKAAKIAETFWRRFGRKSPTQGDPLNGWFDHFKTVKKNSRNIALMIHRSRWRTELQQTADRGWPPYFRMDPPAA
jgi:hypothetical protein